MDVFILKYDIETKANAVYSTEIISIFSNYEKAKVAFSFYLDEIEKAWREIDNTISSYNTFNRFSEPTDDVYLNATCIRSENAAETETEEHTVSIVKYPLE